MRSHVFNASVTFNNTILVVATGRLVHAARLWTFSVIDEAVNTNSSTQLISLLKNRLGRWLHERTGGLPTPQPAPTNPERHYIRVTTVRPRSLSSQASPPSPRQHDAPPTRVQQQLQVPSQDVTLTRRQVEAWSPHPPLFLWVEVQGLNLHRCPIEVHLRPQC